MKKSTPTFTDAVAALLSPVRQRLVATIISETNYCNWEDYRPQSRNTVTGLTEASGLAQSTISHHIKILRDSGVLLSKRKGVAEFLFVNNSLIEKVVEFNQEIELPQVAEMVYEDLSYPRLVEQSEFEEFMEFLSLSGFNLNGKTKLENIEGSIRYYMHPENLPTGHVLEFTYFAASGEVHLRYPRVNERELRRYIRAAVDIVAEYFKAKFSV